MNAAARRASCSGRSRYCIDLLTTELITVIYAEADVFENFKFLKSYITNRKHLQMKC